MTRPRKVNNGLPHRVYERYGSKIYSIGYKARDGKWRFSLKCKVTSKREIDGLRRDAIRRSLAISDDGTELETVAQLIADWLAWQEVLPEEATRKRADSTMDENKREAGNLRDVFGAMAIRDIQPHHAYTYLDKCEEISRGPKGNKEISLFGVILNRAVRKGIIHVNPLTDIEKLPVSPSSHYVEDHELELVVKTGREMGGSAHIIAMAMLAAYLCVRRSVEVRDFRTEQIGDDGILWTAAKKGKNDFVRTVLIEWSPRLKEVIDEAIAIPRHKDQLNTFIFGTLKGEHITKGGWKANLSRLMDKCEARALEDKIDFRKFSLQDLRPKGVTDKKEAKHDDVVDATLHKGSRMVDQVYDRRRTRTAKPTC